MSQPTGSGFFGQRLDDARAVSPYVSSLWRMLTLARQRRRLETELAGSHRQLGHAAEKAQVGGELGATPGVREARTALTAAQAQLERNQGELAAAEEDRRQQEARHNQIVAPIEADYGKLAQDASVAGSAKAAAEKQAGQVERDIQRVEAMLSAAAQGKPSAQPVPALQQQLADLKQTLGPARQSLSAAAEKLQQATTAARQKQAELDHAQDNRKQALATCDEGIGRCRSAIEETETAIGKCEAALAAAHGELGKAVLEANLSGAGIDEFIGRARALMQQIAAVGEQSLQAQTQASANRGGAIRSAAALVVIVLAVSLAWMLAAKLMRPGPPPLAAAATQPAPAVTNTRTTAANSTSSPAATPAAPKPPVSPIVSATLEKGILALPKLNAPTCKVTGKFTVNQVTARAGSARMIDLNLPVEIRASEQAKPLAGDATVRVLVDAHDRILNSDITLPDPDLAELEALGRKQTENR